MAKQPSLVQDGLRKLVKEFDWEVAERALMEVFKARVVDRFGKEHGPDYGLRLKAFTELRLACESVAKIEAIEATNLRIEEKSSYQKPKKIGPGKDHLDAIGDLLEREKRGRETLN